MKSNKKNKRAIVLAVSSLLALQQAVVTPTIASTIIDAGGNTLKPGSGGNYDIRPDGFNGDTGFKHFHEFNLSQGDIANFIFQWYNQAYGTDPNI